MDTNRIILKTIEDKYDRFLSNYALDSSDFLSMEEQSLISGFLRVHKNDGVILYGGFLNAERKLVVFVPEYIPATDEESLIEYFNENPLDCPLQVLDVKVPAQEKVSLSHRDYLGSLMGEGIKREKLGDILVADNGAKILVKRELGKYLEQNYSTVGRASVRATINEISAIELPKVRTEEISVSVSSPRLDNMLSACFNISRKSAVEAISRGLVFVDGVEMSKPDFALKGEEKLVLRGKGKAIYVGAGGNSKKGKLYVNFLKFI